MICRVPPTIVVSADRSAGEKSRTVDEGDLASSILANFKHSQGSNPSISLSTHGRPARILMHRNSNLISIWAANPSRAALNASPKELHANVLLVIAASIQIFV